MNIHVFVNICIYICIYIHRTYNMYNVTYTCICIYVYMYIYYICTYMYIEEHAYLVHNVHCHGSIRD